MKTCLWIAINVILFVSVFSVPVSRSKRDANEDNAIDSTEAVLEQRNEPPATETAELAPKESQEAKPTEPPREERGDEATEQNAELVSGRNDEPPVTGKSEDLITSRSADDVVTSESEIEGKGDDLTPKSAALTLEATLEPKEADSKASTAEPEVEGRNEPTPEGRLVELDATEKSERKRREANELTERSVDEDELTPKSTEDELTPKSTGDELTPKSTDDDLTPRAEPEATTSVTI